MNDDLRVVELTVEEKIFGGLARRLTRMAWVWVDVTRCWEPVEREVRYSW